jgi:ribosomal protein L32
MFCRVATRTSLAQPVSTTWRLPNTGTTTHSFHTSSVLAAVPKNRKTSGQKRKTNQHLLLKPVNHIAKCSNCGYHIHLHHACHECGWYKGEPLTLKAVAKASKQKEVKPEEVCFPIFYLDTARLLQNSKSRRSMLQLIKDSTLHVISCHKCSVYSGLMETAPNQKFIIKKWHAVTLWTWGIQL